MKHTPGPWLVDTIETAPEYTNNTDQLIRISFPKISINGHAEKTGEQLQQEYQQNERLIAAAPDLLEACELAEQVLTEPGVMDIDEWKALSKQVIFKLKTIIKKAKGESL